ncbi:hypothetical protein PHYSODRAFT_314894 [Phytophthora sojae]|uniref:Uncharacterized protein n=1 Tax=Phytophthora sojae (strain P6497) TaxID=1094619 RepID=G4ZI04_PHYSP|nr:hypothetical protein PHYSODRAFT_314894 [Phytophthora sojae]EGZ17647.1 hypothetical protein PHYSODRAFT_314894 [Phytophthora sojae]|eukprot:XP_009526705.1 hypothetical protein PHYSODRAFT_314894 [Phytophthora sojae]
MNQARTGHGEDDKEEEEPRDASAETLTFFSELKRAGELTDEDVIERCNFLMRHAPPNNYLGLRIKGKFVQLIKRLEMIEAAARDFFPEDWMTCTIVNDLFKLWPLLSFMQGIGTLHQVDGRAIDLGRKIMHLLDELSKTYPALAKLLDPPTVISNLQAMKVNPAKVVIPAGLAFGNVPAYVIGHLRATLAPILLPGVVPQFHYFNAPMQNL